MVETIERTDVGEALPQGVERRLALRLLTYWREICGDRQFPSFSDLDPLSIPEMWSHCFVLDAAGYQEDPVFRLVGDEIASRIAIDLVGRHVSAVPENTLFHVATSYCPTVMAKQAPISRGGEFVSLQGVHILYRSVLLPMSDDGEVVSGILGAANCREKGAKR